MRSVPLTRGLVALVDDADFDLVSAFSWYAQRGANTHYAYNRSARLNNGARLTIQMHRLILDLGPWARGGVEVDHVDRNGMNNQRSNLRIVTHAENAANRDNGRLPEIPCATCGAIFRRWRASGRYCSVSCSRRRPDHPRSQRVLPDVVCPGCGQVFRPKNHKSKNCSQACANRARKLGSV